MNRRTFLMTGMAASSISSAVSAADKITLGVIGSGSRGTFVMTTFQKSPELNVAAICDVYEPNLEKALSTASKAGAHPKPYRNYKQLLDDKTIQAVLIATPEHWHHRMVLDALAAGKDVYVEKPLCQTPEQGVELVEAEKRTKQIVQVGMQRRSYDLYIEASKVVQAKTLGDVRMIRSWWLNNGLDVKPAEKLAGPLDWEQWQGPAKRRALDPSRFLHWRLYSEYSGGLIADQGAHVYDGMHLLMNASYPLAVNCSANRPHVPGVDTPESAVVIAEYPEDFLGIFTINYAAMKYQLRNDQLNSLDGDKARMDIGREDFKVFMKGAEDTPAIQKKSERGFGYATDLHVLNFLDCVKTRKAPTAPMWVAFKAALVVQLANASLRQGRRMKWNAKTQKVEA